MCFLVLVCAVNCFNRALWRAVVGLEGSEDEAYLSLALQSFHVANKTTFEVLLQRPAARMINCRSRHCLIWKSHEMILCGSSNQASTPLVSPRRRALGCWARVSRSAEGAQQITENHFRTLPSQIMLGAAVSHPDWSLLGEASASSRWAQLQRSAIEPPDIRGPAALVSFQMTFQSLRPSSDVWNEDVPTN